MNRGAAIVLCAFLAACSTRATSRPYPTGPTDPDGGPVIRVALMVAAPQVGANSAFEWLDAGGNALMSANGGTQWRFERDGLNARVRAVSSTGAATTWQSTLGARATSGMLTVNNRRYRGTIAVVPLDTGLAVVNVLPVENYLRGVVPIEIGTRTESERAAIEVQAIAARSYAYRRMAANRNGPFDIRSSTVDQAYSGYDAEYGRANDAIDATRGLVLLYNGAIAEALYSSTCGGLTARASEIYRMSDLPYLQNVSDEIPGTGRHYCDVSSRFRWTRTLTADQLNGSLQQYLANYVAGANDPGRARNLVVKGTTISGRVADLEIATERGTYTVRAHDTRYILRAPGGEILSSTFYSVEPEIGSDGFLTSVTLRGQGYGHGVGMCQWGAIGRARAGQDFRTILATYYPGTTVGPASVQ